MINSLFPITHPHGKIEFLLCVWYTFFYIRSHAVKHVYGYSYPTGDLQGAYKPVEQGVTIYTIPILNAENSSLTVLYWVSSNWFRYLL